MTSAELITELQAARPVADGALRDRVRTIAARAGSAAVPLRPTLSLDPRRFVLVASLRRQSCCSASPA